MNFGIVWNVSCHDIIQIRISVATVDDQRKVSSCSLLELTDEYRFLKIMIRSTEPETK